MLKDTDDGNLYSIGINHILEYFFVLILMIYEIGRKISKESNNFNFSFELYHLI